MNSNEIDDKIKKKVLNFQRNEITESIIYDKISKTEKVPRNKKILKKISKDEFEHYNSWKKYTHEDVASSKFNIWKYFLISKLFGMTFAIKLMEKGEEQAQQTYEEISKSIPEAKKIMEDEEEHENELVNMIDEERLKYTGSMIRGMNDALVELLGALAGFTLALQNSRLILATGSIVGLAGTLSMFSSEYLAVKEEEAPSPLKAAFYTGIAYLFTVIFLISPYLFLPNLYLSLGLVIINAIIILFAFSFYISVARGISFKKRFLEMMLISLSIAAITFVIGFLARSLLHIEI